MMTYEEYKEAVKAVESYRKEVQETHNRGERLLYQLEINGSVSDATRIQGDAYWTWGINDYFLGDVIPLTDEDAVIWPRLKIMVRDDSRRPWHGPFDFLGVDTHGKYVCPVSSWKFARRCTDKEASQPDE